MGTFGIRTWGNVRGTGSLPEAFLKCKILIKNSNKIICVKSFWVPCMESPSQMPNISIPAMIESQRERH